MSDNTREALTVAISDALHDTYTCGRVWEAWQYETMTEDDFSPAWEDDDLIGSIVDAAIAALATPDPQPEAAKLIRELVWDSCTDANHATTWSNHALRDVPTVCDSCLALEVALIAALTPVPRTTETGDETVDWQQRALDAEASQQELLSILAHVVSQANVNPVEGADGFISRYDMPVGSIHKAIPLLGRFGIVVDEFGAVHRAPTESAVEPEWTDPEPWMVTYEGTANPVFSRHANRVYKSYLVPRTREQYETESGTHHG